MFFYENGFMKEDVHLNCLTKNIFFLVGQFVLMRGTDEMEQKADFKSFKAEVVQLIVDCPDAPDSTDLHLSFDGL